MIGGVSTEAAQPPAYVPKVRAPAVARHCGCEGDCTCSPGAGSANGVELTEEQQRIVEELKRRDSEVRAHEQAHIAAASGMVKSGPHYEFTTGPDGKQYATGGHVNLDSSTPADPREALSKARQLRAAALAPAEPSGQDVSVAQQAIQMESEARQALTESGSEELGGETPGIANQAPEAADNAQADQPAEGESAGAPEGRSMQRHVAEQVYRPQAPEAGWAFWAIG